MAVDVTDATFQAEVVDASTSVAVVVDLWAEWCGPCRTLGPILDTVIDATGGKVKLVKVDVDANPAISQAFRVQSIPAVYALKDGQVVDGFIGAQPQAVVQEFVDRLLPTEEEDETERLLAAGDEASLQAVLAKEPDNAAAIVALAALRVEAGDNDAALDLLAKIPETPESRQVAALARAGGQMPDDVEAQLEALLVNVKGDEEARQAYVDLLEMLGPDDPRTAAYRKRLTSALF